MLAVQVSVRHAVLWAGQSLGWTQAAQWPFPSQTCPPLSLQNVPWAAFAVPQQPAAQVLVTQGEVWAGHVAAIAQAVPPTPQAPASAGPASFPPASVGPPPSLGPASAPGGPPSLPLCPASGLPASVAGVPEQRARARTAKGTTRKTRVARFIEAASCRETARAAATIRLCLKAVPPGMRYLHMRSRYLLI